MPHSRSHRVVGWALISQFIKFLKVNKFQHSVEKIRSHWPFFHSFSSQKTEVTFQSVLIKRRELGYKERRRSKSKEILNELLCFLFIKNLSSSSPDSSSFTISFHLVSLNFTIKIIVIMYYEGDFCSSLFKQCSSASCSMQKILKNLNYQILLVTDFENCIQFCKYLFPFENLHLILQISQ